MTSTVERLRECAEGCRELATNVEKPADRTLLEDIASDIKAEADQVGDWEARLLEIACAH